MDFLKIVGLSVVPTIESGYAAVYGQIATDLPNWVIFLASVIGGIILVSSLVVLFYVAVEKIRFNWFQKIMRRWFDWVRLRNSEKLQLFGMGGLIAFVSLPLPFTGLYTGLTVAYLAGLSARYALIGGILGMIASVIVAMLGWEGVDFIIS